MEGKHNSCYMCGSPATRRITLDLDIDGVKLCDANECASYLRMSLNEGEDDERIERMIQRDRKRLHKARGNKMPKQ